MMIILVSDKTLNEKNQLFLYLRDIRLFFISVFRDAQTNWWMAATHTGKVLCFQLSKVFCNYTETKI